MCRLFGLTASPKRVHASFWLLEAPDSLVEQSRRNPDGTGLGLFDPDGRHPGLRLLESVELAHVGPDLRVTTRIAVDHPPAHVLQLHHPTGQEGSTE